jgi:hypothetical protein
MHSLRQGDPSAYFDKGDSMQRKNSGSDYRISSLRLRTVDQSYFLSIYYGRNEFMQLR